VFSRGERRIMVAGRGRGRRLGRINGRLRPVIGIELTDRNFGN
jgi:hypothetical protein